jgi:DNA-binding HxlR family transcriptional regulator
MLILREAFLGVRRFDHMQRDLGIARNILSDRLGKLVTHGILAKHQYQERPVRHEYRLTDKGLDLYPVIITLMGWGDRYLAPHGAPVALVHRACGQETHPRLVCDVCGEAIDPREMTPRIGPGLARATSA